MDRNRFLEEWCGWYERAYLNANTKPEIVKRNISIIRDGFNSCHAPFMDETFGGGGSL